MELQMYVHRKTKFLRLRNKPSIYIGKGSIQIYTGKIFFFAAGLNLYNKVQ
jgi:hypothetical protein